jgi:hypothetical protein
VLNVASELLRSDAALLAGVRSREAQLCLLRSTDIQCEPCKSSDKLVVRVQSVRRNGSCPGAAGIIQ